MAWTRRCVTDVRNEENVQDTSYAAGKHKALHMEMTYRLFDTCKNSSVTYAWKHVLYCHHRHATNVAHLLPTTDQDNSTSQARHRVMWRNFWQATGTAVDIRPDKRLSLMSNWQGTPQGILSLLLSTPHRVEGCMFCPRRPANTG